MHPKVKFNENDYSTKSESKNFNFPSADGCIILALSGF